MIEHIRKYSGLMIVVFVILFISFFFLDSSALQGISGRNAVLKIDGHGYDEKAYRKLGASSFELVRSLIQSGDFSLYEFLMPLTGGATSEEDAAERFFINRMLLRAAQEEYGIYPSEEEISASIKAMRPFSDQDGKFSQQTYREFLEKGIGRLGMTENDLRELASDVIVSKKLSTILGSGLGVDRNELAKNLALDNQRIDFEVARLGIDAFEEKIQPTAEEVKTYWEVIQDAFVTEPRRKFSYILLTPEAVAEDGENAGTDAAKLAEERRAKQLELDSKVDDFLLKLENRHGAGFEELAQEEGWEIKTADFFSLSEAPADLALALRSSSTGNRAADELFRIVQTSDPFSKFSSAIPVGENQWLIARLDGEESSRAKTFEEAEAEARLQYIAEKAAGEMKKAAEAAIEAIRPQLAEGKSFQDAASEAGLTGYTAAAGVTRFSTPDAESQPRNLFEVGRTVDPGSIADPVVESDRAFIVYVAKREVVKEADADARLDSEVASRTNGNQITAFVSWLEARGDAAKVERLYRR